MKGREGRGVSWESPRNILDEPKARELETRFVKVSSIQTYLVTWAVGKSLHLFSSSAVQTCGYIRPISQDQGESGMSEPTKAPGLWLGLSETCLGYWCSSYVGTYAWWKDVKDVLGKVAQGQ